ncbi:MAG TPA: SUMF1/EgtB/PvdO family nonheme iron enzyme [Sedimentisphaerales bacterium]|nr:SUMF1/EgtB/PvdO family nonheme iron enzyme [Sedimentisphaerales bacterium]
MKSEADSLRFLGKISFAVVLVVLILSLSANGDNYSLICEQLMDGALSNQLNSLPAGFPPALRSRPVTLNPAIESPLAIAQGDVIDLNLFTDVALSASIDRVSTNVNGTVTIRGRIDNYPLGSFIISTTDGNSLASINIPETGQSYRIQKDTLTGSHYLFEENTAQCDKLEDSPPMIPPLPANNTQQLQISQNDIADGTLDSGIVDVMIVYTPAAKQWANNSGGGIENVVAQAVAKGQLALDNSNTGMALNLIYSGEVAYTESGDSYTDLDRLTNVSDGYLDSVHTIRDQYGADIVSLFTNIEDTGGLGWLLSTTSGTPAYAFSINRVQQASWTYTYIHEMGHNMGCHHHKSQNFQAGPGLFTYSAGWRWIGANNNKYCSIMTYESGEYFDDGQTHTRVAYFSDPSITHQGVPVGDASDGNNARNIREIKNVIIAYRASKTRTLNVKSSGASSVNITSSSGHNGTTDYTVNVLSGTNISLSAPAVASGNSFSRWTGDITSTSQTISFSMTANKTVTARYSAVKKPVFNPDEGIYRSKQNVTITCDTPGAVIHYTTNGNDPTQDDPVIASGSSLPIGNSLMLKAGAWKTDEDPSEVKAAYYQITSGCPQTDLNGDCFVDFEDFALLANWYLCDCSLSDGWCDGADFDFSLNIDTLDLEKIASQWLTTKPVEPSMTWVDINDPGVDGYEGFVGQMSKYETTNAQYCQFLNAALAASEITVIGNYVKCTTGFYAGQNYYQINGPGYNYDGAVNGGASRINYTQGSFKVDDGFENHPVTYVSWYGATAFADYYGWYLPTEWQWQAVADYDGTYTYGCGNAINNNEANYYGSNHPNGTTEVGKFGTYGYQLADMTGNVWEWTSTLWNQDYNYRVLCGGCWYSLAGNSSVSKRGLNSPSLMGYFRGFRVCR